MTSLSGLEDSIPHEGLEVENMPQVGEIAPGVGVSGGAPDRSMTRGQGLPESDTTSKVLEGKDNNPKVSTEEKNATTPDDLNVSGLRPRICNLGSTETWGHLFVKLS